MKRMLQFLVVLCLLVGARPTLAAPIVAGSFSTTWDTGSDTTITINLGVCPSAIYWEEVGNASNNGTSTVCVGSNQTITFPTAGQYRTDFSGSFTIINLGNSANKNKFRTVEQWGDSGWTTMASTFAGVTQLVFNAVDTPNLSSVTSLANMFDGATNFNSPVGNWDVSSVTSLFFTFRNASAFNQPLNAWNTSSVTDMRGIFNNASSFNQPLNAWDVSNITQMHTIFAGASAFNQPLNSWDVSSVVSFRGEAPYFDQGMFSGATSFNQPLDAWNTASATDMRWMFYGATSFNQPLNSWDVSGVTNMRGMFQDAAAFNQPVDLWSVANVTDMNLMFSGATAFNQTLGDWLLSDGVYLANILQNSGIDRDNYTATLIGWAGLNLMVDDGQEDIGSIPATYCDTAQPSRDILTTNSWTITDLGSVPCTTPSVSATTDSSTDSGTRIGDRLRRIENATNSSTPAVAVDKESFLVSVRELIDYLLKHDEVIEDLTPDESTRLIIAMRDIVKYLLSWIPGVS